MKCTKILATLGPSTSSPEIIKQLIESGVNAVRVNMSHGSKEQWKEFVSKVRAISVDVPIVMDTRGPEHRMLNVQGEIRLSPNSPFTFSQLPRNDMPYASHPVRALAGQLILLDDGAIPATIVNITDDLVTIKTLADEILTDRRKITIPGSHQELPVLSEKDKQDLTFCRELKIDAIALSFTQSAKDIEECREIVGRDVLIIAKIENRTAVDHIEEIVSAADGVMVARGDLGAEIPLEEVPLVQKHIIRKCNEAGKPAIVATQMLESMTNANTPTRAEVSDVANAILDGADCVMLSGETARGKYPVETVRTMAQIAQRADKEVHSTIAKHRGKLDVAEAISNAVYDLAEDIAVDAIVCATASGFTARMVARFRPRVPIIAVAHEDHVKRQLALTWGVTSCSFTHEESRGHRTILAAVYTALHRGLLREQDIIITTAGVNTKVAGSTNLIEVHQVRDLLAYHEKGA